MKDFAFTWYDTIAYIVPGGIVVWAMSELASRANVGVLHSTLTSSEFVLVVLVLILVYATGHALHTIANFTIDRLPHGGYPPRDYFPNQFEKDFQEPFRSLLYKHIIISLNVQDPQVNDSMVTDEVKITDKREQLNNVVKDAYWICYNAIAQSSTNPLVQVFSSLTGLYRGLSVGSFIIAVAYLAGSFLLNDAILLGVALIAFLAGLLFLSRVARFRKYMTRTVYSDFLLFKLASKVDNK